MRVVGMIDAETSGHRTTPVMFLKEGRLATLHGDTFLGIGVIVTQNVENTVRHEQGQFVVDRSRMRWGLSTCHGGTHDDIAQEKRMIVAIGVGAVGATTGPPGTWCFIDHH